jgi:hypothetical protein
MVAAEKTLTSEASEIDARLCSECGGSGTVRHWNEVAYFEDRRPCTCCDAGRKVGSKITDIVRRAQLEERLANR